MNSSMIGRTLRGKGWTVREACERWRMTTNTFYKYVSDNNRDQATRQRMIDLVNGIPEKEVN